MLILPPVCSEVDRVERPPLEVLSDEIAAGARGNNI